MIGHDVLARPARAIARSRRLPAKHETPIAAAPAVSRCKAIASDIGQQHVGAMSSRSFPHANRTAFRAATPRHIFRSRSGRTALRVEAGMVH